MVRYLIPMEIVEIKRLLNLSRYEDGLTLSGYEKIAGVDEVGRGSLAGPMVAAAVILDKKKLKIEKIDDSKKLSEKNRNIIFKKIMENCVCWSAARVAPLEIDEGSLSRANVKVFVEAVAGLKVKPDIVLSDYINLRFNIRDLDLRFLPIVNGDQQSVSIAAASIVAKVIRDGIMLKLSKHYPEYGFETNKGYGTRKHLLSLQKFGPTKVHRMSFKGVLN